MYDHLELLFPSRMIGVLRDVRGEAWRALVDEVRTKPATSTEHLGFVLMMTRLARCSTCTIDSQRAIRGCAFCARKAVERYKGDDEALLTEYRQACEEVRAFLASHRAPAEMAEAGR